MNTLAHFARVFLVPFFSSVFFLVVLLFRPTREPSAPRIHDTEYRWNRERTLINNYTVWAQRRRGKGSDGFYPQCTDTGVVAEYDKKIQIIYRQKKFKKLNSKFLICYDDRLVKCKSSTIIIISFFITLYVSSLQRNYETSPETHISLGNLIEFKITDQTKCKFLFSIKNVANIWRLPVDITLFLYFTATNNFYAIP